ncbi:MAG: hypothetical protein H8E66_17575 [Planctomycetes bacterium]|nr:hypothetical protein [Planctomycetota bacterium]
MNWVHLHLALNHIPVLGTLFVGLILATAIVKRSEELKRMSFTWFVALTIISIPIKFTGDFAHEAVAESEWLPASGVAAHEQSADQATTGMFLLGLVAAFGLYRGRGQRSIPGWVVGAMVFLALVTFALMARTANLGGQLRHKEIRSVGFNHHRAPIESRNEVIGGLL